MSKVLKGIGNGIRRMIWFKVAPAIIAVDILVDTLGRGAMINEHQVASMLGCGRDLQKGPMSYQRRWKKIDIGFISENGNTMHYENNTPPFYVAPVVHREAYKLTSSVFAVLAHDIKALMGSRDWISLLDIVHGLHGMEHRPWPTWCSYGPRVRLNNPMHTRTLGGLLAKANIDRHRKYFGNDVQEYGVRSESLDWWLNRYPYPPELDMSQYTREPVYKKAYNQETGESFDKGGTTIYYNVGDLKDWLDDPYPMLKQRVGDSETEIVYCVSGPTQHTSRGNPVLKVGFSRDVATFAGRLRHYRCTGFCRTPVVEWAIEVPTRLVLEKRLHNIWLDRMIGPIDQCRSGGEQFEGSPVRWSPERMLWDATGIVGSYGHSYRKVSESDFNREQREIATGCLWK